jgi:hypothetical protein
MRGMRPNAFQFQVLSLSFFFSHLRVCSDPRYASAVFASNELGEDEEEVIVMDLDDSALQPPTAAHTTDADCDWWAVVEHPDGPRHNAPPSETDGCSPLSSPPSPPVRLSTHFTSFSVVGWRTHTHTDKEKEEPALHLDTPQGTAVDGFSLVDDEDVVSAISDFSAQCVRRFRGAKQVDPAQMQQMLSRTFAAVEPPTTLSRVWRWGSLLYSG